MNPRDYFASLPEAEKARLAELAWKCLRIPSIPDFATALEVLAWQRLEIEVTESHANWLEKVKATVERAGRPWTRDEFLRYCALREHE